MKKILGAFEKVSFPDFGVNNVVAKIDTGATSGALHARDVRTITLPTGEKALTFIPHGHSKHITLTQFSLREVTSSNGQTQSRYAVKTTIEINSVQYPITITLSDRTKMTKAVLVGRRFLRRHGFLVDANKGTKYRGVVKEESL